MKKQYIIVPLLFLSGIFYAQDSKNTPVNQETVSSKSQEIDAFKMYPNPVTNGRLFIFSSSKSDKKIEIFDILGKMVISTNLSSGELNVSKLQPGVYILRAFEKGKRSSRKLVIK